MHGDRMLVNAPINESEKARCAVGAPEYFLDNLMKIAIISSRMPGDGQLLFHFKKYERACAFIYR